MEKLRADVDTAIKAMDAKDKKNALKAAQAHVRSQEKWSHPHYWAAWQLWGASR